MHVSVSYHVFLEKDFIGWVSISNDTNSGLWQAHYSYEGKNEFSNFVNKSLAESWMKEIHTRYLALKAFI